MKYLLLTCGDEAAAAHADDGCDGWAAKINAVMVFGHPAAGYGTIEIRLLWRP